MVKAWAKISEHRSTDRFIEVAIYGFLGYYLVRLTMGIF